MKIVVLDGFAMNPGDLSWEGLGKLGDLTVYDRTPKDLILERAKGAQAVFTNKTVLNAYVLSSLPELKYIGVLATGYNVVDINVARERGIVVTNIPSYSTESVAQMVFAHILNITHGVGRYSEEAHSGTWSKKEDFSYTNSPLMELHGKTMGIVGFGNTGSATARIARAFGMNVVAYTSKRLSELPDGTIKARNIKELLAASDIVSLHCPLTPDTAEMINSTSLSIMKKDAILVNTGRGGLVNEKDLAEALSKGKIMAAGIDVMACEPPASDNPLLRQNNCFITPHIAWATVEARNRLMEQTVLNFTSYLEGNIINNVAK